MSAQADSSGSDDVDSIDQEEEEVTLPAQISISTLVQEDGIIPFTGLTSDARSGYPDAVNVDGERFEADAPSFHDAIKALPQARKADIQIANPYVEGGESAVSIDTGAIGEIESLDFEDLESLTGQSFSDLASAAAAWAQPRYDAEGSSAVIDPRRLALRTLLDVDCRFHWQLASDQYEPGDMDRIFREKIRACDDDSAFGWIRFRDYGGEVKITTIYPEVRCEANLNTLPEDVDITGDTFEVGDGSKVEEAFIDPEEENAGADSESSTLTLYYGEKMAYGFRGLQRISATPVIYVPNRDILIPFPIQDSAFTFDRVHRGDFMNRRHEKENDRQSPLEWHETMLDRLKDLTTTIETEVIRSNLLSVDFSQYPFDVASFYEYLGVRNTNDSFPVSFAEVAAEKVKDVTSYSGYFCSTCDDEFETFDALESHHQAAHDESLNRDELDPSHVPQPKPTLWTLQIALKMAILEEYGGSKASDRYHQYVQIAGDLLRRPAQQIDLAITEHNIRAEETDEETVEVSKEQQTLAEALSDVEGMEGIIQQEVRLTESQRLQREVQQQLGDIEING